MATNSKIEFFRIVKNKKANPPRWADWLLEKLCHEEALEELQGDLHESFLWRLEDEGVRYAKWHFVKEIFQSIRLSNLKPYPFMQQFFTLFSSHIKTGWRFIWKTRGYSAINISGLSVGIVFSWFAYQYINRAREVAVRKIIGAQRKGVFQQLMTEAFLTTLIATFLAVILYVILAPYFSNFVEKTFDISTLIDGRFVPGNVGLILLISLLSGVYPAIVLSRFQIIETLKGQQRVGKGKLIMQSLLIVQFSISTAMIVCMLVFKEQLNLLLNQDLGHDITNVVKINFPPEMIQPQKTKNFLNELQQQSAIAQVTGSSGFNMSPYQDGEVSFGLMNMEVDSLYMQVMGLRFQEGSYFTEPSTASKEAIVNEAFIEKINLTNPIGKTIPFGRDKGSESSSIIIGVLVNTLSNPKSTPEAKVYFPENDERVVRQIFLKTTNPQVNIEQAVAPIWDEFFYPYPFTYEYLEEAHAEKLEHESRIAKISGLGSVIAIFIAAFGLVGLIGVTIRQKLKRLSISRVLGAEKKHIATLVSNKFILPIFISLTLGLASSTYLSRSWLESYTVRMDLSWYHFTLASLIILGIPILIVWVQVGEALKKNPVIHLKED